jgi:DNA-binding MarR family transcriptional regulator
MSSASRLVFDLCLAQRRVARDVDAGLGAHHGVGLNDLALLVLLGEAPDGKLRRVELAHALGVTTSGVARQLAPLERIGLVDREPSPGDARLALVVLTETGRRIAGEASETAERTAERALDAVWSAAEQKRLAELLANVT